MQAEIENLARTQGNVWMVAAQQGEVMEAFKENAYPAFNEFILKEIEEGALKTLKSPDLDLTNLNHLYQLRALCQVADIIRKRIDDKIQRGKDARTNLKKLNSTQNQEGEYEG